MLGEAVAIVSKESASRELLLEGFSNAFREAGFTIEIAPVREAQQ